MGSTEIKQTIGPLDQDSRYAIRVRSIDGLGNKSGWSESIEIDTAAFESPRPLSPRIVDINWDGNGLYIGWDPSVYNTDGTRASISIYEVNIWDDSSSEEFPLVALLSNNLHLSISNSDLLRFGYGGGTASIAIVAIGATGYRSEISAESTYTALKTRPNDTRAPVLGLMDGDIAVSLAPSSNDPILGFSLEVRVGSASNPWNEVGATESIQVGDTNVAYIPEGLYIYKNPTNPVHSFRTRAIDVFGRRSLSPSAPSSITP